MTPLHSFLPCCLLLVRRSTVCDDDLVVGRDRAKLTFIPVSSSLPSDVGPSPSHTQHERSSPLRRLLRNRSRSGSFVPPQFPSASESLSSRAQLPPSFRFPTGHILAHTSLSIVALSSRPSQHTTEAILGKGKGTERLSVFEVNGLASDVRELDGGMERASEEVRMRWGKESVRMVICSAGVVSRLKDRVREKYFSERRGLNDALLGLASMQLHPEKSIAQIDAVKVSCRILTVWRWGRKERFTRDEVVLLRGSPSPPSNSTPCRTSWPTSTSSRSFRQSRTSRPSLRSRKTQRGVFFGAS